VREALRVIDRVLSPPCELLELWSDSPELEGWRRSRE